MLFLILILVILTTILAIYFVIKLFFFHVPFVPTPKIVRKKMIAAAEIRAGQKIWELGSGTGDILFDAEKSCPRAEFRGFEILRPLIWISKIRKFFRRSKIKFFCADFFQQNFSDVDVVFCYLWPSIMEKIFREKFPEMKKNAKIISHGFPIKNFSAEKKIEIGRAKIWIYRKK